VTRRGLHSSDYSDEARARLGEAVEAARRALGCETRNQFVAESGVKLRSLEKIEAGEGGVGPRVFDRLHRALPGWNAGTVREILEGGPIPEPVDKPLFRLDIQYHARDEISTLLASSPEAAVVLDKLLGWHQDFKKAGLSGDDLLAVSQDALKSR
jgi:hypothetical protein